MQPRQKIIRLIKGPVDKRKGIKIADFARNKKFLKN